MHSRTRIGITALFVTFAMVAGACGSGNILDGAIAAKDQANPATRSVGGSDPAGSTNAATNDLLALPDANPSTITFTLDDQSAATATIDASGGKVSTVSSGVTITLTVPAGALTVPTDISITPVNDAKSDMIDLTLGGVQFSPAGLVLSEPAILKFEGADLPDDPMAVTWTEDGGEVIRTFSMPTIGGGVSVPIVHFSGAGAGTPGDGAPDSQPSSPSQRARDLISDAWNANGNKCIHADNPAGVTALNYYIADAEENIIPGLKRAQSDDLALLPAADALIRWWTIPDIFEVLTDAVVCYDMVTAFKTARDELSAEIGTRLKAGFTHAIYESARQCKEHYDRGELSHMMRWAVRAALLTTFDEMGTQSDWTDLATEAVNSCALYRIELRTQFTLDSGEAGNIRGTISATADRIEDEIVSELINGGSEDSQFLFDTQNYTLELPHGSATCSYQDLSTLEAMSGEHFSMRGKKPDRIIPGLDGNDKGSTDAGRSGDQNNSDNQARAGDAYLVLTPLVGGGTINVQCKNQSIQFPLMANLIPDWFDAGHYSESHGGLYFPLDKHDGGQLVADYTTDEPIVDPTESSAVVEQHTEIKVFHTPEGLGPEPPPPPDQFQR